VYGQKTLRWYQDVTGRYPITEEEAKKLKTDRGPRNQSWLEQAPLQIAPLSIKDWSYQDFENEGALGAILLIELTERIIFFFRYVERNPDIDEGELDEADQAVSVLSNWVARKMIN
jgi:hypothetical protein